MSWQKSSDSSEVAAYGTNQPYQNYSNTKLRTLTLGNAMFEGFSDGKKVEGNILDIEAAMTMVLDDEKGFAAPYVWSVFAGDKSYGLFIIQNVSVTEKMRDLSGNATRAFVDVELQEVSPYQVASGIDLTSPATGGRFTSEVEAATNIQSTSQAANQEAAVAGARGASAPTPANPRTPSAPQTPQTPPTYAAPQPSRTISRSGRTGSSLTSSPNANGFYAVGGYVYQLGQDAPYAVLTD